MSDLRLFHALNLETPSEENLERLGHLLGCGLGHLGHLGGPNPLGANGNPVNPGMADGLTQPGATEDQKDPSEVPSENAGEN